MYTYAQLRVISQRVLQQLAQNQDQLDSAVAQFASVEAALTAMGTSYSEWATQVNDLATANPNDEAVVALKADKDRMVAEFNASKTRATALKTAVDGI